MRLFEVVQAIAGDTNKGFSRKSDPKLVYSIRNGQLQCTPDGSNWVLSYATHSLNFMDSNEFVVVDIPKPEPKKVSFDEAIKAFLQGKMVVSNLDEAYKLESSDMVVRFHVAEIEGEWTILEGE